MRLFFQNFHLKLLSYLIYNYEDFVQNPRWFIMRRTARLHIIRDWKAHFVKKPDILDKNQPIKSDIFTDIDINDFAGTLDKYGLSQGINLSASIVEEILEFALNTKCYANKKPHFGFWLHEREKAQLRYKDKILTGKYYNTSLQCQAIIKLQSDPILVEIAARYLKAKPVHIANSLWWSFPVDSNFFEQSKSAQVFHCDLDDYKFLKFFFYLTDVDLDCGPHAYILGSHNNKKFLHQILRGRAIEQDLIDYYGSQNIVTICGSAGWGFAEDTFGFHKGSPPINKPRLMLQVEFATYDYGMQNDLVENLS
jgi:hypothetical protein